VAGNTEKIALGTSVIDVLFHNPVILARRFATLDVFIRRKSNSRMWYWLVKRRVPPTAEEATNNIQKICIGQARTF
jgi:hypothetical protein